MILLKATYGGKDCTEQLEKRIVNDKLVVRANNDIIGDPLVGQVKYLEISYSHGDLVYFDKYREGDLATLPKTNTNRLGIFYSNNNNHEIWDSIYMSLDSIKVAAENNADIITCLWEDMPLNPFVNVRSWYHSTSHLNQLLQIMQCLYMAKDMGQYEYVSFLEHDVLYPKGYFDYEAFDHGEVYTNMNYGGVNFNGWQTRRQDDEPFHQMTMRMDDAIEHCLTILPNALKTNSGLIETQKLKRKQWRCENEAIHINHGVHFTSHNSIYSKNNTTQEHKYWGNHKHYKHLFHEQNKRDFDSVCDCSKPK